MTDILEILRSDLVYRLGWALLHSLWQIALLASFLALLLTAFRRRSANLRYLTACAGLGAMFALPLVTYWIVPDRPASEWAAVSMPPGNPRALPVDTVLPNAEPPGAALPSAPPREFVPATPGTERNSLPLAGQPFPEPTPPAEPAAPLSERVSQAVSPWVPWLVLAWFVGVFVLSVWHLGGWIALQRLKYLGTTAGSEPLACRLAELIERMQLSRPVRMFQSEVVDVPAVIGWLRPVLLVPAAMLGEMSPPQIDAVLAHELAHVRRYDYLVNLLQTVIETLLFYHPAVWWLSRRIRIERENCCDDAAVAVCGSSLDYAAALMAMERGRVAPRLAVAAGGAGRGGTALSRVRRVLNVSGHDPVRPQTSLLGVFTAVALVGLLAGYIATAGEQPQKPDQAAEQRPEEEEAAEDAEEVTRKLGDPKIDPQRPWTVLGTVTDQQGRLLDGVELRANCGMGSLMPTGETLSDQQGNYTLRFGPGMRIRKDDGTWGAGVQAATIFAFKSGYTEKNLCRQGGLLMGDKLPEKGDHWYGQRERVVVPGKPRRLDFVMVPAASLEGEVVDEQGKPISDKQISVRGKQMLPSTSVLAQGKTDREGRFRFEGIPADYGWWFSVADQGRTQPITFPGPGSYRVKLQLAHYAQYNLDVFRITSVTDPQGNEVGDKLVEDDPSVRPPVAEELQDEGRSYLRKMAAACRHWLGPPPAGVQNYEYRFRLGNDSPKTYRVDDPARAAGAIRQGITYFGTPHILASRPEKVVFRQVEVGQDTILLRFLVQDSVKIAAGNGISGTWRGYFSTPLREGLLVLDKTTYRPVRTDIGGVRETFSRYMGLGDGRFVPLAIRIEKGSMNWDWKFRLYQPGLWLLAESRTGDGEDRSELLVTVDEVKVNGKAAVAMAQDGAPARPDQPEGSSGTGSREAAYVELVLDKRAYFLGENVLLHYGVTNRGEEPFEVGFGHDYRGSPRALRFKVIATDENGRPVDDPYPSVMNMGGLGGERTLKSDEAFWASLPLMRYCDFEKPGVYKIRVYHDLGWEKADPGEKWKNLMTNALPQGPHRAPIVETTIKLMLPNREQARRVVAEMLALPTDANATYGRKTRPYQDVTTLRHPVYLRIVEELARKGSQPGATAVGSIPTPEATRALIRLLDCPDRDIAAKSLELLLRRLPLSDLDKYAFRANQQRLARRSWRDEMQPEVVAVGWKLLAKKDRPSLIKAARIFECLGRPTDFPRFMKALNRVLEDMKDDPTEQNAYPRPANASGSMIRAGWQLIERGAPVPSDPQTPGQAALFMLALGRRADFRPADWQATAGGLLRHPIPYVRSVTLENLRNVPLGPLGEAVIPLLSDEHLAVSIPACELAATTKAEQYREPLLEVLRAADDQWLMQSAHRAALACGAGRDRVLEICIDQLGRPRPVDSSLYPWILALMIEVVEREGGHGHSNTDWSKAGELAARWRRLLEANREQIRAGRLFKIGEPPLTPGLFPRGFHFQRKDKPPWPDWSGNAAESEIVPDEPAAGGEKAAARGPAVEGAPPDPTAKLVQAFEKAKYGWQQLEIAQQMVKSGDRSLIPALSRHLDSDDEHLRCNAGFVLAGLGDERGLEAIISELKTKKLRPLERPRSDTGEPFLEQRYGYYAIHVLGKLRDKRAVPVLIEFLDKEQEHRDIEWALGEIGDQRATAALKRVLKHEDPHRHLWAGSALAKLGDPAGVPTVAKFLKDSQWTYRRHAAEGLGASGDARAVPHLIEALSDESPDVRVSACQALAEFGDPKALPHLEKLLDDRTTTKTRGPTVVRDEARKAVESIQSKQPRWGPAVEGVQVRLRADKRVWKAGDTPTFKADIRNGAKSTLYDTRGRRTIYNLEFDGQWYIDPSRVRKRPLAIRAGGEHAGGGVLPLSPKNWRRTEPPRTLELTPGKHTMRVALVGTLGAVTEAGGGKPVRAVSNPVEIEIVADKPAPDAEKAAAPSVEVYRKHVANLVLPQRDDPYVPSQKWLKERLAAAVPYLFETRVKYKDQFSRVPVVADLLFKAWEQGLLSDRQKRSLLENTLLVGWDLREAYPPGYAREGGVSFRGVIVQTDVLSDPFGPEGPLKASYRVVLEDKQQVGEHAKGTVIQQGETRGSDSKYLWFPAHLQPGDYPLKVRLEVTKRAGQWRHSWWRPGQLRIDPELKPESIVAPGSENLPQEKAVRFVEGLAKQYAWDSGEQKFLVTAPAVKIEPRAGFDMDIVARLPIEVEIDGKIFGKPHFYGGFSCIDGHSPPGRQYTFQPSPDVPLRPGKFRWRIVLVPDLRWAWTEPGVDRLCNRKLTSPWYTAEITIADLDAFRQQQTLGERATDFDTKLRHFRNALTWQSDHPEKVALEYRVAVMLKEFYDSRTSTWPRRKEALAMFRGIVDRYDHMAYYTNMGAGGRWEAQVAVPNAAVRAASLLSVLGSDKEEVARYRSRALEMMNQTCRRRIREWSTAPRPQEPDAMLGGLGERSKHQFRVAEWERRKKAAAIGKVLSASELETVKGIVPSIDRSRGGRATPQVLARLRQIAESYRGTAIARIAQQRLEAAKGDPGVLLRQLNAGELSDEKIRQITDKVLDLQADLDQKWDGAWGNWLETARVMGKVSDADFTRYAKQSNPTWKLLALQITREDGKLGLSFGISHFGGRVASSTTDHNLIIKHRLVRLRLGDVPLDVGNTGGEWSFAATTQHGFGLFREKSEIEGLEKLEPGKYEAVAEIEVTIYEAGKPDTTLHLLRTQVKDELKLTPLLLGSAARPGASEPTAEDANDEAWGKAVAGVQCRLEADKPTWGAAEMLTLKAYVRHQTETILFLSNHPSFGARLEVDGHWHRWSGPMGQWQGQSHGSSKFRTKDEQPLKITLDVNWKQVDNKQPLGLDPGRHVVRFAWEGFAEKGPRQGPDQQREVVLLSNPVEITIRPDSPQPKLADVHPDDKDAAVALQRLGAILAAGDQGRIRSVRLSRTAVTDADLGHFKGLSGLRSLHLDDTRISDAGLRHIAGLAGLKTLSVNYTQVGDAGLEHLKGLGQLSLLELLETEVTAAGLRELKKALPGLQATVDPLKLSGLAELRGWRNSAGLNDDYGLVSVDLLGPKVADAWLERLKDRHTLQDVCLDRRNITDAGLAHLQGLANLHTLYLSGTQVTDRGLEYLKGMKKLRTLFLAETPIGDAGLAHLSGLTDLELLWINGTRVTDAGLVHLKPLTKLTRLKLNDCQVSGAGLSHLRGLTKLTTLELNGTAVADAGLVHVRPFVNLELLYLSHTSVTDAGLGHLSGLTKLRALMIEHAHVTDQGIKMLKLALPKTSFYH